MSTCVKFIFGKLRATVFQAAVTGLWLRKVIGEDLYLNLVTHGVMHT